MIGACPNANWVDYTKKRNKNCYIKQNICCFDENRKIQLCKSTGVCEREMSERLLFGWLGILDTKNSLDNLFEM